MPHPAPARTTTPLDLPRLVMRRASVVGALVLLLALVLGLARVGEDIDDEVDAAMALAGVVARLGQLGQTGQTGQLGPLGQLGPGDDGSALHALHALHALLHPASVGCCVLRRRSTYVAAGIENERFVSWGAEDDERLARALTLGLDVQRSSGPLYHLRHARGPDSSVDNPHFTDNVRELERISAMNRHELSAEVATWPWATEAARR